MLVTAEIHVTARNGHDLPGGSNPQSNTQNCRHPADSAVGYCMRLALLHAVLFADRVPT